MIKPRLYADDNRAVAELALHVLGETLALAHPIIPFVTEEIWSHIPGTDGLLMVHRYPEADDALRDEEAEAEVARAIAATQELRGWRDRVGAAAGKAVPARLDAAGLRPHRRPRRAARARRVVGRRRRAGRHDRRARRQRSRCSRPRPSTSRPPPSAPRARRATLEQGDRARRGQARQPGLRRQGARRRWSRPSARSSSGSSGSWRSCSGDAVAPRGRRGPPALARAVRHAVRARAHAAAADRARQPAGAVRGDPRGGHQRQVVDRADVRGAAGGPRRARRRVPVAAPDELRRADPDRRRRPRRRRVRRRRAARRRGGREGRPHARSRATA